MPPIRLAAVSCSSLAVVAALLAAGPVAPAATASAAFGPITAVRTAAEARAESADGEPLKAYSGDELTLKRIFPDDPIFGTSASSPAFSHDGRWAVWLHRPSAERRHGNDLWLLDTESGALERITKVSVLREFQASTRQVSEDRIRAAKKRAATADKSKSGDEEDAGDGTTAAPVDDGLSGTWTGRLTGESDELGDGIDITLTLRLTSSGTVEGTMTDETGTATITGGSFKDGELDCVVVEPETGLRGRIRGTVKDGSLDASLTVEGADMTLRLTAERTAAATLGADDDSDGDDSDSDSDSDTEDLGDTVDAKDAKNRTAPRYGGVQSFTWAPEADELIFTSGGDLYRFTVEDRGITRLTRTRELERAAQYLPNGGGYTFLRDSQLIKVAWGDHTAEQVDPALPRGETLADYRISPDGRFVSFVTTRGTSWWGSGRQVTIVNYRSRFAQANDVARHMPDDTIPDYFWRVWIYDTAGHLEERGELVQVLEKKMSGPRDVVQTPEWAPDSSRACFSVFDQATGMVDILETRIPQPEPADEDADAEKKDAADTADADSAEPAADDAPAAVKASPARPVYRFAHTHGPNTPGMIRPWYLADSRRLVFIAEMSGFRHLHVLDPLYEELRQLTSGRYEVYPFDMSDDHERLFVTATKEHPSREDVYMVDLESGDMSRLTERAGVHSGAAVSDDGRHVLANHIDFDALRELYWIDTDAGTDRALTDSHDDNARRLTVPTPEYFSFENRHGQTIHGHWFRPDDWEAGDQRPLLLYVYGGPLGMRKMITRGAFSAPSYFFADYMARKHGWVTATIDPRGASGFGGLFEKSNFEQVGRPQVEDLVDASKWLVEHAGVDKDRMAMHGWSFGGFQTQMTLYTEPDVFAAGIAGAGPTQWKNYNTWYTTGTIGERWREQGLPDGDTYSLVPLAKNLKARLLLVHGMEDSNVLYQDTVNVYRALLKAGKEGLVDLFLDPTGGHGLGGDVKTIGRYRKYEAWLLQVLGTGAGGGEAARAAAAAGGDDDSDADDDADADEDGHDDDDD